MRLPRATGDRARKHRPRRPRPADLRVPGRTRYWAAQQTARLPIAGPGRGHGGGQRATGLRFRPAQLRAAGSDSALLWPARNPPALQQPGKSRGRRKRRRARGGACILSGGGPLSPSLLKNLSSKLAVKLYNVFGPTEAADDVASWDCGEFNDIQRVLIGKPISNTQLYILDKNLQPVPIGVIGELHVGGIGLARGYRNRDDLTKKSFIANPFAKEGNSRLYKTGDLCRYLPDGNIECLGRIDHQVKIRGFRIELGEVESKY